MKFPVLARSILLHLAVLAPAPAFADCRALVTGLEETMAEYRSQRETNEQNLAKLREIATSCKSAGVTVSEKASHLADGLSCVSQGEVSALDRQIRDLGASCESKFTTVTVAQEALRTEFEATKGDISGALEVINGDKLMSDICADELKTAKTMSAAYESLETSISSVLAEATGGAKEYAAMKTSGQELAAHTATLNLHCGASPESAPAPQLSHEGMLAKGNGAGTRPVPSGVSAGSASDVTGTAKARDDEKAAEALIRATK